MNSTLAANPIDAIICPLDGRRSSKELYSKLVVVHFTTIAAFCHFLSVTKDPLLSIRPITFALTPFNIIFQYGVALVAIALGSIVSFESGSYIPSVKLQSPKEPLQWLFGMPPKKGPSYTPLHTEAPIRRTSSGLNSKGWTASVGRTVVQAAFLSQCICTIFLYSRRKQQNAVILVDKRIFELACGGIVISILTIAIALRILMFVKKVPDRPPSRLSKFVGFCRYSTNVKLWTEGDEDGAPLYLRTPVFWKESLLSCLVTAVCGEFRILEPFQNIVNDTFFQDGEGRDGGDFEQTGFLISLTASSMLAFSYTAMSCFILVERKTRNRSLKDIRQRPIEGWVWCGLLGPLLIPLFMLIIFLIFAAIPVIAVMAREYARMFSQITILDSWSEEVACPMLWSDPLANYIW
jgi:hypothetical protein